MNGLIAALQRYAEISDRAPGRLGAPSGTFNQAQDPLSFMNASMIGRSPTTPTSLTQASAPPPPPAAPVINLTQNMPPPIQSLGSGTAISPASSVDNNNLPDNTRLGGNTQPAKPQRPTKSPEELRREEMIRQAGQINSYMNQYSSTGGYNAMLSGGSGAGYGPMNTTIGGKFY